MSRNIAGLTNQVVQLRSDNPNMRAIRIAEELGCSRERVRQLLKKAHLPTKVPNYVPTKSAPLYKLHTRIVPPIKASTCLKVPPRCPKCQSAYLYLEETPESWDVCCAICGQLVTFVTKVGHSHLRPAVAGGSNNAVYPSQDDIGLGTGVRECSCVRT